MPTEQELRDLERSFLTQGPDFYRANLTDDAVFVFPDPVGIMGRETCIEAIEQAPRWAEVEIDDVHVLEFGDDFVSVIYRATARMEGSEDPYRALVSSVYSGTKLALHQQTPLDVPHS